ncbi:VCBS repeat-containing protein [Pelagicoccus sp. SDUM812002]|uniref:FG-GAP repeat domain-containing protein n=1 Tax=Pelagicoccus sp. SDUM812002 TaxID=3041266 RepID=UPI00280E717F|nr:VCBS repeat-containing protein [Pelagicoccus sp. SDUM812002]MDQ8187717.1 VCBS repeat-containing protein [Pelagicoccus sp. SDUM812002]
MPRLPIPFRIPLAAAAILGICLPRNQASDALAPLSLPSYVPRTIGFPAESEAWITDLSIADLDGDGHRDVIAAEGRLHRISALFGEGDLSFAETVLNEQTAGPAHVEACDFDQDGDLDLLVACMGIIFPSNQRIGSIEILEQTAPRAFKRHVIAEQIARVTDLRAGDLDGDGDLDLAVGQFGYEQGEVRWLENLGNWQFTSHPLLALPGAIHTPIADLDGDGHLDIVALISQQWEEVHFFKGNGNGSFQNQVIFASSNQDYGSSGLSLSDIDADGDLDVLYTNGDGFDYARPGPRPHHGLQVLYNDGGRFLNQRIADFAGAFSPHAVDLNQDGRLDILVTSCFNHWENNPVSLAAYLALPDGSYQEHPLAHQPTHLVVVDSADFDGDGKVELVTGTFQVYPPFDPLSRITLWTATENL